MKSVDVQHTSLDACVADAQSEQVVVTRDGHPVALVVGVQGLDEDQIRLATSDKFWSLISDRRKERTLTRAALTEKAEAVSSPSREP